MPPMIVYHQGNTESFIRLTARMKKKTTQHPTSLTTGAMVQWLERPHCSR